MEQDSSGLTSAINQKLAYTGNGTDLAVLMIKNLLLSILTLSIYRAWAKTNFRRYVWGHVSFDGDRASYVGTGEELFKGWLKLAGLFIATVIAVKVLSLISPLLNIFIMLAYALIFAIAAYSGLRYRLSRTMWRQIRFGVDKDKKSTQDFLTIYFVGVFLSIITLGIYFPFFRNSIRKFLTDRSRYGSQHFHYAGQANKYAILYYKGLALTVVTLGFYGPVMYWSLLKYRLEHTRFQNARLVSDLSAGTFWKFSLGSVFLSIITLGIAFPWLFNYGLHLVINSFRLVGELDLKTITAKESDGSAMAEDIVSGYDIDLGF